MSAWISRRVLLTVTGALLLVFASAGNRFDSPVKAYDPEDEVIIRPPTGVGSGSGDFDSLDAAIDEYPFSASVGQLEIRCRATCLNELEKVAVWQGFPDGFEPFRLEITRDAIGGISLAPGRASRVYLLVEYDIGNGWEVAQEETWENEIPACSEAHPSRCSPNVFVKELSPEQSTGAIKVRATVRATMTACGNVQRQHKLSSVPGSLPVGGSQCPGSYSCSRSERPALRQNGSWT